MYLFSRIGHFKKNNIERTRISRWFGRENEENVVRTKDWCGWPSSPRQTDFDLFKDIKGTIDELSSNPPILGLARLVYQVIYN